MKQLIYLFFTTILLFSCNQGKNQTDDIARKYLGTWSYVTKNQQSKSQPSVEIFEESGTLFIKFIRKDEILPLELNEKTNIYEVKTFVGILPVPIINDTLRYSKSKYVKIPH